MSQIAIRTYQGDGADLAELTNRIWRGAVGGKMLFPLWDRDYFQWRLLDPRAGGSDFHLAAYDGDRLVGCVLAEPRTFDVLGQRKRATLSSWLTVDKGAKDPRLALRLLAELRRRHREREMAFSMGYAGSAARDFWAGLAARSPGEIQFLDRISFWSRPFDAAAVGASGFSFVERHGPRLARYLPALRQVPRTPVRAFDAARDLSRCLDWLSAQAAGAEVRIVWEPERLELELAHPRARTLVLDDGERGGFINYYSIRMLGAAEVQVGVIDLFAGTLPFLQTLALLGAACDRMREEGVELAVMMRAASAPSRAMLAAGFVPYPTDVELFWYFNDPTLSPARPRNYHILFG